MVNPGIFMAHYVEGCVIIAVHYLSRWPGSPAKVSIPGPGRCLAESVFSAPSSPAKLKTGSQKLKPSPGTSSTA